jgi:hypothetical protein
MRSDQRGIAQQRQGRLRSASGISTSAGSLGFRRLLDLAFLQLLTLEQHLAEFALEHRVFQLELSGGQAGEGLPVLGRVQVEAVHMQGFAPADQEIDFEHVEAGVFRDNPGHASGDHRTAARHRAR